MRLCTFRTTTIYLCRGNCASSDGWTAAQSAAAAAIRSRTITVTSTRAKPSARLAWSWSIALKSKIEVTHMGRTTYYQTCPDCGANLDPGERCMCRHPHGPFYINPALIKVRASHKQKEETTYDPSTCSGVRVV